MGDVVLSEDVGKRQAAVLQELAAEKEFDVTVVNDYLERAAGELVGLLGSPVLASRT